MTNVVGEVGDGLLSERIGIPEFIENSVEFGRNVLGKTEPIAILADTDSPNFTRPRIDILKQVSMQREIVIEIEFAGRERLLGAGQEQRELHFIQKCLILNVEQVPEDCCVGIAEWIGLGSVDQAATCLAPAS